MSKLKTVWDAVNEFKGEWIFSFTNLCNSTTKESYFAINSMSDTDANEYFICTKKEFNALVEEMTLGLDVNHVNRGHYLSYVNHGHYLNYVNAGKAPLEKEAKVDYTSEEFWKDAPKDATHYKLSANDPSSSCWYMVKANLFAMMYRGAWKGTGWHSIDVIDNNVGRINVTFIPRPQSTPTETPEEKEALDSIVNKPLVYTQEMADNGVNKKRSRTLYGKGIVDGIKSSDDNGKKTKCYSVWSGMMERCYSPKSLEKHPTYLDCYVCDEWLSLKNFSLWFDENYISGLHLDKDILVKGNKEYGPSFCSFVPREVNNLFTGKRKDKGDYPQGVCRDRSKYSAMMSVRGRQVRLGSFDTPELAFYRYKEMKEQHVKDVDKEYFDKGLIVKSVFDSLMDWAIELDTRTKKEKAIDEIFNNRVWDNSIELLGLAYDEWAGE